MPAHIENIFVGGPQTLVDARGAWHSSIARQRREDAVNVTPRGLEGDSVAQPYHGSPDAALCVQLNDHYAFWRSSYGVTLPAGAVGENFTLSGITEDTVFAGDVVRCGSALAQVSGPRVPCATLARRIGRPDWVKLTIQENRTGFYMRVLESGRVQAGDMWHLIDRPNSRASISEINRCMYLDFDVAYAESMLHMQGLGVWWREQAAEKLQRGDSHWTSDLKR